MKMSAMDWVVWVLLFVGGLNWGLVGAFKYDLVAAIFGGEENVIARIIYVLVGLAALWSLVRLFSGESKESAPMQ